MAEEQDREITFSSTDSSKEQQNGEQSLQNKLLIASGGYQAPRKAAHCLRKEVGQKY